MSQTSETQNETSETLADAGFSGSLGKPILPSQLYRALAEVVEKRQVHESPPVDQAAPIDADASAQVQSESPPVVASKPTGAPIDFEALLQRCRGNTRAFEKMLIKFENRVHDEADQISASVEAADAGRLLELADSLQAMAGNVMAAGIEEIAGDLAELGRGGQLEQAQVALDKLGLEIEHSLTYLPKAQQFLKDYNALTPKII